jgi:hypothetical protein
MMAMFNSFFGDYFSAMTLLLSRQGVFGLTWGAVLAAIVLVGSFVLLVISLFRITRKIFCTKGLLFMEFPGVPERDRQWFQLATLILGRAECAVGLSARTVVRGLPGIVLNEDGSVTSLGPSPFTGLIAVAAALRREAGLLVILPLLLNKETRRVIHLIPSQHYDK